jgi:undecaprenyl-diphosphatase
MHVLLHTIHSADITIYHFLTGFAGNWALDRLASHEESENILKGGFFFAIYWYLWFRDGPGRERRRRDVIAIVIAAPLAIIMSRAVAFLVPFRLRPIYDPALAHAVYSIPFTPNLENWSSFPSDTAAFFSALAFGLVHLMRRLAIPIVLYTVAWICLFRMYLGIHYASDMVAGSVIGITTVWVVLRSDILQSIVTRRVLTAMEMKPERFYAIAFLLSFEMASDFAGSRSIGKAVVKAAQFALHHGSTYSRSLSPIDALAGFLAIAGFSVAGAYLVAMLRRIFSRNRAVLERGGSADLNRVAFTDGAGNAHGVFDHSRHSDSREIP